jgi:hypothetical protein
MMIFLMMPIIILCYHYPMNNGSNTLLYSLRTIVNGVIHCDDSFMNVYLGKTVPAGKKAN